MSDKKVFKRRATELQLQAALNDAARLTLTKEESVLVELRIKTLLRILEGVKAVKSLGELARLRSENSAFKAEIEQLKNTQNGRVQSVPAPTGRLSNGKSLVESLKS